MGRFLNEGMCVCLCRGVNRVYTRVGTFVNVCECVCVCVGQDMYKVDLDR